MEIKRSGSQPSTKGRLFAPHRNPCHRSIRLSHAISAPSRTNPFVLASKVPRAADARIRSTERRGTVCAAG